MMVIRIRTPRTITAADVRELIMRGVEAVYPGTSPQAFYEDIARRIAEDSLGVFVGFFNKTPQAVVIGLLPTSPLMMGAQVALAYTEGPITLSRMIGERLHKWLAQHDHDRFFSLNLQHDNDVFCRVWRHVGESSVVGSIVETRLR